MPEILPPEKLQKMHWKERWEYEAAHERARFRSLSEAELLEKVQKNQVGSYYMFWYVLAEKGTVTKAAPVLWEYLQKHPGKSHDLDRYHCTAALFQILGMPDPYCKNELRKQVQWDHKGEGARQLALQGLKKIIDMQIRTA